MFTYPRWLMTKGLTDLLGPCGGTRCCVLDLFPCKLPQCSTAVEWKPSAFVWPPPQCSCRVCASALLSVDFVQFGLSHVLSVSVIDFWVILMRFSPGIYFVLLQSKSVYCLCEFSLLLNALCICLFFSNPLTWLLFFLLPSVL